jgi:hypothetical protein
MKRYIYGAMIALGFATYATGASAVVLLNTNLNAGPIASPGSVGSTFNAPGSGSGALSFQIQGYRSLDGDNFYRDDFSLFVNGVLTYSGTFDLGGGGNNVVTLAPSGSTFLVTPPSTGTPTFGGGLADIVVPISFIAGSNSLLFSYNSPSSGPSGPLAGPQGLSDEGWAINGVTVTSAIPELSTWAMMLIGFAGLAFSAGRKRRVAAAV